MLAELQTRRMIEYSGRWRHWQRFHTVLGMPFGPGAEEFRRESSTFLKSSNVLNSGEVVSCSTGSSSSSSSCVLFQSTLTGS